MPGIFIDEGDRLSGIDASELSGSVSRMLAVGCTVSNQSDVWRQKLYSIHASVRYGAVDPINLKQRLNPSKRRRSGPSVTNCRRTMTSAAVRHSASASTTDRRDSLVVNQFYRRRWSSLSSWLFYDRRCDFTLGLLDIGHQIGTSY